LNYTQRNAKSSKLDAPNLNCARPRRHFEHFERIGLRTRSGVGTVDIVGILICRLQLVPPDQQLGQLNLNLGKQKGSMRNHL
jgi:hypothetical protein